MVNPPHHLGRPTKMLKGISLLAILALTGMAGYSGLNLEGIDSDSSSPSKDMLFKTYFQLNGFADPLFKKLLTDNYYRTLEEYKASRGAFLTCDDHCRENRRRLESARHAIVVRAREEQHATAEAKRAAAAERRIFSHMTTEERVPVRVHEHVAERVAAKEHLWEVQHGRQEERDAEHVAAIDLARAELGLAPHKTYGEKHARNAKAVRVAERRGDGTKATTATTPADSDIQQEYANEGYDPVHGNPDDRYDIDMAADIVANADADDHNEYAAAAAAADALKGPDEEITVVQADYDATAQAGTAFSGSAQRTANLQGVADAAVFALPEGDVSGDLTVAQGGPGIQEDYDEVTASSISDIPQDEEEETLDDKRARLEAGGGSRKQNKDARKKKRARDDDEPDVNGKGVDDQELEDGADMTVGDFEDLEWAQDVSNNAVFEAAHVAQVVQSDGGSNAEADTDTADFDGKDSWIHKDSSPEDGTQDGVPAMAGFAGLPTYETESAAGAASISLFVFVATIGFAVTVNL